jgi:hypothetical protein
MGLFPGFGVTVARLAVGRPGFHGHGCSLLWLGRRDAGQGPAAVRSCGARGGHDVSGLGSTGLDVEPTLAAVVGRSGGGVQGRRVFCSALARRRQGKQLEPG